MAQTARNFPFRRQAEGEAEAERRILLEGLTSTKVLINQAYAAFNATHDPDLIESYVFEINALQSRYTYFLRRVRELERAGAPQDGREQAEAQAAASGLEEACVNLFGSDGGKDGLI